MKLVATLAAIMPQRYIGADCRRDSFFLNGIALLSGANA
jgi:hypothetical protein